MSQTNSGKVFGIGLSKTGTTSLARALEILGYKTKDYPGLERYTPGDLACMSEKDLASHDAFTDTPIPSFYKELDAKFPNSKFILTVRDSAAWLKSCKKQFNKAHADQQTPELRQLMVDLYGTPVFDSDKFDAGYRRHVDGVRRYFEHRDNDLLIMDIEGGSDWEQLSEFLGKPIPSVPFPKANVTNITWMNVEDIVDIAEDGGQLLRSATEKSTTGGALFKSEIFWGGGKDAYIKRRVLKVAKTLKRRLTALNSDIPIVSRLSDERALRQRVNWNHYWLLEVLDGESGLLSGLPYSINISLMQDGLPIYGVVHIPLSEVTYYTRFGAAVHKKANGSKSSLPAGAPSDIRPGSSNENRKSEDSPLSIAAQICVAIEEKRLPLQISRIVHEAEVASAYLVAANSGALILEGESESDNDLENFAFNKESPFSKGLRVLWET